MATACNHGQASLVRTSTLLAALALALTGCYTAHEPGGGGIILMDSGPGVRDAGGPIRPDAGPPPPIDAGPIACSSDLLLSCEGQGYGSITVIEPTLSMRMPDDAREASTALQRRWGTEMKCSAYLVEGSGFLPAAVRTMTAGMALVTRSPYPVKVFSDGPGCASWVGPVVDLTGLEVERAVKEARSAR